MTTYSGRAVYYNMTTGGYSFEDISILDDDANMWQSSPENFAPEARLHLGSGDVTLDLALSGTFYIWVEDVFGGARYHATRAIQVDADHVLILPGSTGSYASTPEDLVADFHTPSGITFASTISGYSRFGLTPSSENDLFAGTDQPDTIIGGIGNDTIKGFKGDDLIYGGADRDLIKGKGGKDDLRGDDGADTIRGGNGRDYIEGGDDDDRILGERDDDTIYGGNGDDRIFGGHGDDSLHGGAGHDRFVFTKLSDGHDVVRDFLQGQDLLDLRRTGLEWSELDIQVTALATEVRFGDTVIEVLGGATLHEGDFLLS